MPQTSRRSLLTLPPDLPLAPRDVEGLLDELRARHAHFSPLFARTEQRLVAQTLGEPEGVLIIDGSEVPKKGDASGGVARQYCGALGNIANCLAGVFVAHAGSKGYTLLDAGCAYRPCGSRPPIGPAVGGVGFHQARGLARRRPWPGG